MWAQGNGIESEFGDTGEVRGGKRRGSYDVNTVFKYDIQLKIKLNP